MDKITCSTLCLKESYNCEAFYFKDNACMIIKDTAAFYMYTAVRIMATGIRHNTTVVLHTATTRAP